jgi:hypothetical protein
MYKLPLTVAPLLVEVKIAPANAGAELRASKVATAAKVPTVARFRFFIFGIRPSKYSKSAPTFATRLRL